MARVLVNDDVSSLYPNLARIFGYNSRNQKDKDAYVNLLDLRLQAKHNKVDEAFLRELSLTNKDLKGGLKLPLNAYTGALRAKFNALYDSLQGFSICTTGQLLLLQLAFDLKKIPTVEMISLNTDAVMFMVDEEYLDQSKQVLLDWQHLTKLELEEDDIQKIIMRDVNNYVEIVKTGDNDYEVHYKGGLFSGKHDFKWDKENYKFNYTFSDDLKSNSLTICAEAILKELLFDIPCEETINKCDDIFRFQMISHLGSTYMYMVQQDGAEYTQLPQRNNRIYAGKVKNGMIYKVKENKDGTLRYDKLANCPPNPIIDNKNKLGINDINKKWYITYAKQKINDFIGGNEVFMDEKLDKLKKDELIEMVVNLKNQVEETPVANTAFDTAPFCEKCQIKLLQKINEFRKQVRDHNFILDKVLPNNLGGGEYYSADQIYNAIQEIALSVGLDFAFEVVDVIRFDLAGFKPATGAPQHIATVKCEITLCDIDTGAMQKYTMISQGSDSIDKAVNSASSYALRNWFDKNFTPCIINGERVQYGDENSFSVETVPTEVKSQPKTPTFVPQEKKEQIVKEITQEPQKESTGQEDVDVLTDLIYEYRELSGDTKAGGKKLEAIMNGSYSDIDIMNWTLSFQNAVNDIKEGRTNE